MKKILFLAALALSTASAWAVDIVEGKTYTIKAYFTSYDDLYFTNTDGVLSFNTSMVETNSYWIAEASGNASYPWKFKSAVDESKYLTGESAGLSATAMNFRVDDCPGGTTAHLWAYISGGTGDRNVGTWSPTGAGKSGFGRYGAGGCWGNQHNNGTWTTEYVIEKVITNLEEAKTDALALSERIGEGLGKYHFDGDKTYGYNEAVEACTTIEEVKTLMNSVTINLPKRGQMFRIKASSDWISNDTYLAGEKASNEHLAFVQRTDFDAWAEDNTIWVYDGQYLVNYANGLTVASTAPQYGHGTLGMYPNSTPVTFRAADNGSVGRYNFGFAGNRNLYTNKSLYTDAGANADSEGYNFELVDAVSYFQLTFSDKGWATGYFPIDVAANYEYGIDAAYVINADPENGYFKAQQVEGTIPAFTPVVLKVRTTEGYRPFVKGAPNDDSTPLPSVLSGALWKQAAPANSYVFNVIGDEPGFYKYTGENLGHMKAYYEAPAATESVLRINFGDDVFTGIMEAIEKEQFSGAIFDLQGRRVNGMQNGVFVKNGKKVIR